MHELAICQSLLREVAHIAADRHARSVTDIHVGIGPLSGVNVGDRTRVPVGGDMRNLAQQGLTNR